MVSSDMDTFDAKSYLQNAFENFHQNVDGFSYLIEISILFDLTCGYHASLEKDLISNLEDSFHDSFTHPRHLHFLLQSDANYEVHL